MRAMDAEKLSLAAPAAGYAPWGTIDGHVLLRQLVDVFDKGEQAPVPMLAGFNSGEIRSLRVLAPKPPANAAAYETTIRDQYADLADEFLRLYPSANMEESVLATTRDALYGWTAQRLVRKQTALGQPSFLYFSIMATRPPTLPVCMASTRANCPMSSVRSMARRRSGRRFRQRRRDEVSPTR